MKSKEVIIPNRMTGVGCKLTIRSTNGSAYKAHVMIYWELYGKYVDGLPVIKKIIIKARPWKGATARTDFLESLINESLIGINRNLKKGGVFEQEVRALGKSGFVGVIGNYVHDNFHDILHKKPDNIFIDGKLEQKIVELQLDSKNRLSTNYKDQLLTGEAV